MKRFLFIIVFLSLASCVTRAQVDALTWLTNTGVPMKELCDKNPDISNYGFYRKLNDGKLEFISICNSLAGDMISMTSSDYSKIMSQLIPKN